MEDEELPVILAEGNSETYEILKMCNDSRRYTFYRALVKHNVRGTQICKLLQITGYKEGLMEAVLENRDDLLEALNQKSAQFSKDTGRSMPVAVVSEKAKSEEIEHSNQDLDERKKDLEAKKSELEEIVSETKQEEEKLREKAKVLETTIEPRLLQAFKRIRKNSRNGLGIVYVQRDACGGCFNKIPPQKQLDIRMRKKIIVCEYCGRIMIDPELAGVIAEQHLETVKR